MSANTDQKSLVFMEAANNALAASEKLARDVREEKQAAEKRASVLVDALIARQLVEATERDLVLAKMATHAGGLEIAGNLLNVMAQRERQWAEKLAVASGQGQPHNGHDKAASGTGRPKTLHVIGQRAGLGEKRASDDPLRRLAGL